eukprot:TRINITY_DN3232_c2_g1_i1.p1 TRINITY_DN3232_c2_g1~~TRINITY_DN3232_c2_g1_i1.p1  ORF type:complete len:317 (+),score=64.04 TRINITY_DN3232_c2_g1_i1:73-1023(+)
MGRAEDHTAGSDTEEGLLNNTEGRHHITSLDLGDDDAAEEPVRPHWSRGLTVRAAQKAALAAGALGVVCYVGAHFNRPNLDPRFNTDTAPASMEVLMANAVLVSGECRNTPKWSNGFFQCNTNGYAGLGCSPTGFTCEAYELNGWCLGGRQVKGKEWAMGEKLNFPELNCCVCGGGSSTSRQAEADPVPPTPPPIVANKPATCSSYSKCEGLGDGSRCCPNDNGIYLDCCKSPMVCRDTSLWTNGYTKCKKFGFKAEQGCTPGGVNCEGYVAQGFCKDGAVVKGKEWTLGGRFNHPELNCCACGKHADGTLDNGVF